MISLLVWPTLMHMLFRFIDTNGGYCLGNILNVSILEMQIFELAKGLAKTRLPYNCSSDH